MKIKQIHFFRYGMFFDTVFDLPSNGLQVIYGVNEAGKSTMMRFIRDVLFGFSAQSPGISDEGNRTFGGRLTFELPERGVVTVERTGNRGRGSAKVYFEDGRISGEETMAELLPGLDETMFQAVFSFGLDGLQGLERVKADELNDYLFHAGMTGDFSIRELEKKLAKKQDELFKPQGRKPVLNRQLAELEAVEKEVSAWQQKNENYRKIEGQADVVEQRIREVAEEKSELRREVRALEKQKALAPFVKEKRELELRLEQVPKPYEPFPEDGLARYDQWRTQAVALEAELAELEADREAVEEKLESLKVRKDWLERKEEVRFEREREGLMQSKENERAAHGQTLKAEEEELAVLRERLGPAWTEEVIKAADTGFSAKDALKKLVQERESLQQRRRVMDEERARMERQLEESRAEEKAVRENRLGDQERHRMEDLLRGRNEMEGKRQRKKELEERFARTGGTSSRFAFYGGTALGTAVVIWMIASGQWLAGAVIAGLTAGFAFYILRSGGENGHSHLKGELESLATDLNRMENIGIEEVEKAKLILREDDRKRQSETIVKDRLEQGEKAYDEAVEQTEAARQQLKTTGRKITEWCSIHHFPEGISQDLLLETFEIVEDAKNRIRNRDRAKERSRSIEIELEKRENNVRNLSRVFEVHFENSTAAITRMAERIEEQEHQSNEEERFKENSREYRKRSDSLKEKIERYNRECEHLMRQAEVESEEAYRRKGKAWTESQAILNEVTSVKAKMEALIPDEQERESAADAVWQQEGHEDEGIRRRENELEKLEAKEHQLYEKKANLNEQKKQLEEGGTYAELLHRFARKKDHFHVEAKKWAVYRTAEHLLNQAKEQYRNKRLPKVVEAASSYFALMTEGQYAAVFAPEDKGFIVERMDGIRFSPNQLSRGTAEQLYLAVRLALARIYQSPSPYPMIMDDILVNFDSHRSGKAAKTIREAATHHQILFFTCHAHLLEHFSKGEILSIEPASLTTF